LDRALAVVHASIANKQGLPEQLIALGLLRRINLDAIKVALKSANTLSTAAAVGLFSTVSWSRRQNSSDVFLAIAHVPLVDVLLVGVRTE
jgi:hypothetical protein